MQLSYGARHEPPHPQTTPRHELRAEKARRNKGEPGSATGSRNRANALAAFIGKKAEIDEMLARLQALSDDHFNAHPDEVNWGHVGTLEHYARWGGCRPLQTASQCARMAALKPHR